MTQRFYNVRAVWDEAAKVYVTESDIIGLHVEAATLEEFERIVNEEAAELIVANHLTANDIATRALRDLIPTIFLRPASGELH